MELEELAQHPAVTHYYDFGTIRLTPFVMHVETRPEIAHLHAHAAAKWIALDDWEQLPWAPADVTIIERLLQTETVNVWTKIQGHPLPRSWRAHLDWRRFILKR